MEHAICPVCEKTIRVLTTECPFCGWDFKPSETLEKRNTRLLYSHWATLILGAGLFISLLFAVALFFATGYFILNWNGDNAFLCFIGFVNAFAYMIVILRVLDQPEKK